MEHVIVIALRDLSASQKFHEAVFGVLKIPMGGTGKGYYAAFVLDPDGNNIDAVFHGEARRSAASVKVTF